MSQYLLYDGFEWVDPNIDITIISDTSNVGFLLEVDLEYPQHSHYLHRDLPFCPEHSAPPGCKTKKLLATLHNKTKYVIQYRALKQTLKHGLKLTKIHRVLKFNQSPWLKSYIALNTALRQAAKNEFEKNLFKLMNNAVFAKTMDNIRKHSIVKLISKWEGRYGAEALISKAQFKVATIFNENLVAIELNKTEVYFNKHFNCHSHFDTSDYPPDNGYNMPRVNKKVLGMMTDEFNGVPMELFVGLRSKMYAVKRAMNADDRAVLSSDACVTKKIKGIRRSVIKNIITKGRMKHYRGGITLLWSSIIE